MSDMISVIRTRWFKFVLRTLVDWAAFIFIIIIMLEIRNIVDPPRCYFNHIDWQIRQ